MPGESWLIKLPSENYVYAYLEPEDPEKSAAAVGVRLAGLHSFTYLRHIERIAAADAPAEALRQIEQAEREEGKRRAQAREEQAPGEEEPVAPRWPEGVEPRAGYWLCRLRSTTYAPLPDALAEGDAFWAEAKRLLRLPTAISLAEPEIEVLPPTSAEGDLRQWLLYGATDRVVIPLWPSTTVAELEKAMAWKGIPATLRKPLPCEGEHVMVVAVYPEHLRGMECRRWHGRRDDRKGMGTVQGRYPVDVAVSVPTAESSYHRHSFAEISPRDWRPGLVFYCETAEDGCPLSYVCERLDQYCAPGNAVDETTWRAWAGCEG